MRILLTNDDGIHAEGLKVLERIAAKFSDDVWVVAPETDQSGLAHSLTLSEPLRLREVGTQKFALKGTPTDCVIMGVRELLPGEPDLILSGVNSGQNVSDDITYSGTVAGAMEGALMGIRSIALSQAFDWDSRHHHIAWQTAETHAPDLIKKMLKIEFPRRTLVNINFPNCAPEAVKGAVVTRQSTYIHGLHAEKRSDGRGFPYYWIRFSKRGNTHDAGSDVYEIERNRISVTPLKLDLTDQEFFDRVDGVLQDEGAAD